MGLIQYLAPVVCLLHATILSDVILLEIFLFLTFKKALVGLEIMKIPSETPGRESGAFMEAIVDTEGIMVNTGNGLTKVVHFEPCFEGEESS